MVKKFFNHSVIFVLSSSIFISCQRSSKVTNFEAFPDMAHSKAAEAFMANEVLPNGMTNQLPPTKSIARGRMPVRYEAGEEEAIRAGATLVDPYETTEQTLARGKEAFGNYCLVCHGELGKGDGPIIPKFPNPPSFYSDLIRSYTKGRIFFTITRGIRNMPSHAAQVREEDRWYIAQYVKKLQEEN